MTNIYGLKKQIKKSQKRLKILKRENYERKYDTAIDKLQSKIKRVKNEIKHIKENRKSKRRK
jgi:hypothetical protein